jgi:hypothetical protein
MTQEEKWELCKPILLQKDWTQEDIDSADEKTRNEIIAAVDDFLKRQHKKQYEDCMKVLAYTNMEFSALDKSLTFAEEYELEQILSAVEAVDKQRLLMLYKILGKEKFTEIFLQEDC